MPCNHPDPSLCSRLGWHIEGRNYALYCGNPVFRAKCDDEAYQRKMNNPAARPVALGRREIPCIHEGAVLEHCTGCNSNSRHVRDCDLHERATRAYVSDKVRACALCADYKPGVEPWEWVSLARLTRDTIAFGARVPRPLCGIGGVVRSGMIPASILATLLHLPLWEIGEEGDPRQLRSGNRGKGINEQGPLLIVDDTVWAGTARQKVRKALAGVPHLYAAIYVRDGMESFVDLYHQTLTKLHVLEWNWHTNGGVRSWNQDRSKGRGFAIDLDGIVCHDEHSGGPPGEPFMVPRAHPVPYIVTGRGEEDRARTVSQLRNWGCQYENLVMRPTSVPFTVDSIAYFKSAEFRKSGCELFIESCPNQAALIAHHTNKAVICPKIERAWQCT